MKLYKIFGFMLTFAIASQALAFDSPPFNSLVCVAGDVSVQVKVAT